MKIKTKSILSIMLALNLVFPIGYINNIDSYATTISEDELIDTWKTKTPMPTSRNYPNNAVVNGKIYCIGGYDGSSYLNKAEVYDPTTDTWETKTPMPTSRTGLTSAVVDGKIYCIGGYNNDDSYLNKVEVYDPTTDTWETKTSMPTSRGYLTSSVVNGKIYCIGGFGVFDGDYVNEVEVYDPITDTWETKSPMSSGRDVLTSAVVNGKIYCIGGNDWDGDYLNKVEVYDPITDTWKTKTSMPTYRGGLASAVVDGKIYCIGGYNNDDSYLNKVEVYDPTTDTWETKSPMPTSRNGLTSAVVDGKIYCIGGIGELGGSFSVLNTVEVYTARINTPEDRAEQAVISAENSKETADIENARDLVNNLPESMIKDQFQDRLNNLFPNLKLENKVASGNADVYIKCKNTLSMSLNTNNILFDEYSGVEDIEKLNAVELTVHSSLPYKVSAYLAHEIQNADKTKTMDISVLKIKANSEQSYNTFNNTVSPIILFDDQNSGNAISHGIDLKLSSDLAHKADVYKTVIKFEAEQK